MRSRRGLRIAGLLFQFLRGSQVTDLSRNTRLLRTHRKIAVALSRGRPHAFQLTIRQRHIPVLRNQEALAGELLLNAHRALAGADTHRAGSIEPDEHILRAISNGDRMRLNLWRIDRQRGLAFDAGVNRAAVKSDGQRTDRTSTGRGVRDRKW